MSGPFTEGGYPIFGRSTPPPELPDVPPIEAVIAEIEEDMCRWAAAVRVAHDEESRAHYGRLLGGGWDRLMRLGRFRRS